MWVEKIASVEKITLTRVLLNPIGTYKDDVDELNPPGVEAFIDVATNKFSATCKYLFTHHLWPRNPDEAVNQTWEMFVRATGAGAENPLDSDKIILPQKSKFVLLQKGDYDNNGADKYGKPKSGDQYKPGVKGNLVTSLQNDLITTEYLPKESADGLFGDQTEAAIREFQKHAIGSLRMKRKTGKHEKAERLLEQPSPDGIAGKKTRDQLDWWLSQGFIIPKPTLREDVYDDDGVKKRLGVKGGEDHHQSYVVSDSQRSLDSAGAQPGKIDGWFGPKMKQAVELFQESAQRGEFLIGGVVTKLEKKLERFVKGEMDQKTREYLEMVVGKGGKVVNDGSKDLIIKKIVLPNEKVSFTTKDGENEINAIAEIKSSAIPKDLEKEIAWELEDDPDSPGDSNPPKVDTIKGADVKIKITIPKKPEGRNWEPLKYRIRAKILHDGKTIFSAWMKFGQDEKDMLRQQYIDMSKAKVPARNEFKNSGKSTYFTLAEGACNCGHHTWHLWTIMSNLDDVRSSLDKSMQVNSGYRCPIRNTTIGGKGESRHQYGDAADISVRDLNDDKKADKSDWELLERAAKDAGATYTEDYKDTGTWVHMDWR